MDEKLHTETETGDTGPSLLGILMQLSLHKKTLLTWMLAGLIVSAALLLVLPARYVAEAKLMPPRQIASTAALMSQLGSAEGASSLAAAAGAGLSLKNPNDIYVAMLQSRPVADAIIARFSLQQTYRKAVLSDARRTLAKGTSIESSKDGLISITVTDRDRALAPAIANAYIDELRRISRQLSSTEAGRRALFYEDQLATSKDNLTRAETAFQQTQQSKGMVQLEAQGKAAIEGVARLREEIAAKEVAVATLRSYVTEGNPRLKLAEQELAALRGQAAQLDRGETHSGSTELGLRNFPASGLDYLRAQRELQYQQALYNILLKQYEAAKLDESKDAVLIQTLEPAIVPDRKAFPRRMLTLAMGLLGGLLAGCGWVYLQYAMMKNPLLVEESRSLIRSLTQWS